MFGDRNEIVPQGSVARSPGALPHNAGYVTIGDMRHPQFDWISAEADRHRRVARLLEPALTATERVADQYRGMVDQAAQLLDSPALKAAEQAADQYRRTADQAAQFLDSPALKAAERAADQYRRTADQAAQFLDSSALRAAEQAADQYRRTADQAAQFLDSPALKAAEQMADQYHRMADRAAQLLDSPALKAAEQAARQLYESEALAADRLANSPALKAADQYRRIADQAAVQFEQAHRAASKLLARMPQLTPELFGGAWNENVAEAVRRLEQTEVIAKDADVEDAATVQTAAPPEAQARVKARLSWLRVRRAFMRFQKFCTQATTGLAVLTFLGVPVPTAQELGTLLGVTAPPDRPSVPAPDLPTPEELEPTSTALHLPSDWAVEGLPGIVQRAGPVAAERMVEFFTSQIRNVNTREAYAKAVTQFFNWCDERGLELYQISPVAVAIYIDEMQDVYRAPTIKQHLAAIRRLFNWLVVGQVIAWNPTAAVRGPTHIVKRGKTPVFQPAEVRLLLDSIDTSTVGGLRDRALLGVMTYSFARVSGVVNMDVDDYYQQGKRWWLRLREKGGKHHAVPLHHKAEAYLDAYLQSAGIATERGSPLWRSLTRTRDLGERRMSRVDVFRMIKRRLKPLALRNAANCHTFRASGITAYLLNGGTLERAQAIAGHESARTTQLYARPANITVEDVDRIKI